MGKKHVIQQSQEEATKEAAKVDEAVKKEAKIKTVERISEGRAYISSSYNNTIITLADLSGRVLVWKSAGSVGFKGAKKGTAFASSKVAETIANAALKIGIEKIYVFVKGIGPGRDSAVRALMTHGLNIMAIKDVTPIPHNGCRPAKARRV
jgi:small subunit ribosomal protein S11